MLLQRENLPQRRVYGPALGRIFLIIVIRILHRLALLVVQHLNEAGVSVDEVMNEPDHHGDGSTWGGQTEPGQPLDEGGHQVSWKMAGAQEDIGQVEKSGLV